MQICKEGYLNIFVKPESEGGLGLCDWMATVMTETRAYSTSEVYAAVQNSGLHADVKALSQSQIKDILEWMIGKTFENVTFGRVTNQQITYIQPVIEE